MVGARFSLARYRHGSTALHKTRSGGGMLHGRKRIPDTEIPSSAGGEMTAGEILRYLAEAVPEQVWLQLSLEQVPIKGTP
jgi:hypothetical protein